MVRGFAVVGCVLGLTIAVHSSAADKLAVNTGPAATSALQRQPPPDQSPSRRRTGWSRWRTSTN